MSSVGVEQEILVILDDVEMPPADDQLCHIENANTGTTYCGRRLRNDEISSCKTYNGEAICTTCGRPTCPSCALQSELNQRLES